MDMCLFVIDEAREVFILAQCQNFNTGRGNQQGVLVLGRRHVICSGGSPAVLAVDFHLPGSCIDHRLNGEGHASFKQQVEVVFIMQHLRIFVETAADAVAAVVSYDRKMIFAAPISARLEPGRTVLMAAYIASCEHWHS